MPGTIEFCKVTTLGRNHVLVSGKGRKRICKFYVYSILQNTWTTIKPGPGIDGSATFGAIGTQVLGVDNDGNTFLASNIMTLLGDDLTEASTSYSLSANSSRRHLRLSRKRSDASNSSVASDDGSTPWWTSAASASMRNLNYQPNAVEVPANDGEVDHISVLAEDEDTLSVSSRSLSSPSSSNDRRRQRAIVHQLETIDSFGRKMGYSGHVSKSHNRPHGKGRMGWIKSGDVYAGTFRHGRLDGLSQMEYGNGDSFEGIFQKDLRCGHGLFRSKKDNRIYEGNYENDLPNDPSGSMTWKDGTIYVGSFIQGKRTGKGVQRFRSGVRYEGDFVSGKYHGFGVCEFADGSIYRGHWVRGKAHGRGRLTKENGEVIHDGLWECDGPVYED